MKYIKSIPALLCAMLFPITAFAKQTAPEEPMKRISWAMDNCGSMPRFMLAGFILLAAMIIVTILVAKMKGADKNE